LIESLFPDRHVHIQEDGKMAFDVRDGDFEQRIRMSFGQQGLNATIGARLGRVTAGYVEIELPFSVAVTQQHEFFHGSVMGAIGDSACGYAAMTLTAANTEVLTVEYKINFLSPARGELLVARGRVTKPGRTLTVCTADVFAISTGQEKLVATMLATIMAVGVPRDVAPIPPGTTERIGHQLVRSRRWCPCRGLRGVRQKVSHVITH
jgi:uncharacterized protein (TIGR00369 family)